MSADQEFLFQQLPHILEKLEAETSPRWGLMSAQHMVEHLSGTSYLAMGKIPVQLSIPEERIPESLAFLWSEKPYKRNLRVTGVPEKPGPVRFASLEEAKQKMIATLEKFRAFADANPSYEALHPVFGTLNRAGWERFMHRHTVHHFRQFGLLPDPQEV